MPRILNPEILKGWSLEEIRELEKYIGELLKGYPRGIYYILLHQMEMPNCDFKTLFEEMKKCKNLEELETLHDRLKKKYGAKKTDIYSIFLLGTEKPKGENVQDIILKVKKFR